MEKRIRVALVERDTGYRSGLEAIISTAEDMECVGCMVPSRNVFQSVANVKADVVLFGLSSELGSQARLIQQVTRHCPATAVIVLADFNDPGVISQCLRAGAVGYLLRTNSWKQVAKAVRDVYGGGSSFCPRVATEVLKLFRSQATATGTHSLSGREHEIVRLLRQGTRNKEIAIALNLSVATVRTYLQTIYLKLRVSSRAEAIRKLNQPTGSQDSTDKEQNGVARIQRWKQ